VHWDASSSCAFVSPWFRLLRSVELVELGRFWICCVTFASSSAAAAQLPWWMSVETCWSWLVRLPAVLDESRPVLLPQAAIIETARPSPPATSARCPWRIRALTLERRAVGF
jgi:hypothetical protein